MQFYMTGITATWHYTKHCWIFEHDGRTYHCDDDELVPTIIALTKEPG